MTDVQELKRRAGRRPFDERVKFDGRGFAACPFHSGDGQTAFHLKQQDDGAWTATCFSACGKTWDAIAFVQEKDKVTFSEAVERIQPKPGTTAPLPLPPKKKVEPLTPELWAKWGREITESDVAKFTAARPHSASPSLEWFQRNCRVKGEYIGLPYWTDENRSSAYMLKMRKIDSKDFITEHKVSYEGLSNLSAVNLMDDVYVVEGDIGDVGVMEDAGFVAVSVVTGKQERFEPAAIKRLSEAPRIFLVGDQAKAGEEDPGQKCIDALQTLLPAEKTFRVKFDDAKDVGELAKKTDLASRIENLRDDVLTPWVLRNIPMVHQLPKLPLKWVVEEFLPHGGLAILSGPMGAQKSMLGMWAAHCISGRDEFLGRPVFTSVKGERVSQIGMPVLYLDRENPVSMVNERREKLGIIGNRNFRYWGTWDKELLPDSPDDPRLLELAKSGCYFIFDSLQMWLGDHDENSNSEMLDLMKKFLRLARVGAGVLILHHHGRTDTATGKSRTRGASAITAVSDMAFTVGKKDEDQSVIEIRAERFRLCGPWEMDYKVRFAKVDSKYTHVFEVIRDEEPVEIIAREKQQQEDAKTAHEKEEKEQLDKLDQFLKANPKAGQRAIADALGVSQSRGVPKLLKKGQWKKEADGWVQLLPEAGSGAMPGGAEAEFFR